MFLQISHLHRWQLYLKRFWNMKLHLYMNLNFPEKVRIREWTEDGESATWQYDFQNAADTFVNDLMNTEKWFTFRIHAEEKLPEYRVDIENRVKKAVLDEGDKEVCFPVIMKEVSREDEEIWTDALERNAYLEETFKLQDGESDYRSFEEIKADTESNKILITSTKPVSRELHNKQSTDSIMREFTDNYLNPFIEQKWQSLSWKKKEPEIQMSKNIFFPTKRRSRRKSQRIQHHLQWQHQRRTCRGDCEICSESGRNARDFLQADEWEADAFEAVLDKKCFLAEETDWIKLGWLSDAGYVVSYSDHHAEVRKQLFPYIKRSTLRNSANYADR